MWLRQLRSLSHCLHRTAHIMCGVSYRVSFTSTQCRGRGLSLLILTTPRSWQAEPGQTQTQRLKVQLQVPTAYPLSPTGLPRMPTAHPGRGCQPEEGSSPVAHAPHTWQAPWAPEPSLGQQRDKSSCLFLQRPHPGHQEGLLLGSQGQGSGRLSHSLPGTHTWQLQISGTWTGLLTPQRTTRDTGNSLLGRGLPPTQ